MNQLEKEILYWLRETRKPRMGVEELARILKKDVSKIIFTLDILEDNHLVEVERTSTGRVIRRAKITEDGKNQLKESTRIVTKESVKDTISELKDKIYSLEQEFEKMQQDPSEENKKSFLEKVETFQSVANGVAPWIKAGIDLLIHKP